MSVTDPRAAVDSPTEQPPRYERIGVRSDFSGQNRLLATVEGRNVVVFRIGDAWVGIPAECPHNGGPICDGELTGETVTCPWHGYNFNLLTGACEDDEALSLSLHDVLIVGEDIFLKL